ncbi:MAG: DNA polymerase III subunit beta [Fibromonadaceae bacterium]|jgi:DNA polymerase-3 subunit beta|nr:DNA polymerase III subunit beta [Fibromonadaceae bacterium]
MIFNAEKSALSPVLSAAKLVVPARPAIPIAGCFLLRLKGNDLEIAANDVTGLGISLSIQVEGEKDGCIAVSAMDFADTVANAPDGKLAISSEKLNLKVSWGEERYADLNGRNPDDFIKTPEIETDCHLALKVPALSFLLSKVAFAASKSIENRPSLTGILLEADESKLVAVGTDSHRLSRLYLQPETEEAFSLDRSAIVPPRAVQVLLAAANAVGEAEATVSMGFSETYLKFKTSNASVVAKLLEGPYPAWRPVIPAVLPISIKLNTAIMLDALNRVNAATDKSTHSARLTLQGSEMKISATASRHVRERIACIYENPQGVDSELHLGVNSNYLIEILKACGTEEIEILVNGEHSLCEVLPSGENSDLLFLLMLIRLAE